jgi:nucleotide-binding universal stress UspA family protein
MSRPETILLATDLSARSDRAMDRAALLMNQSEARLLVVHVLDPSVRTTLPAHELVARARRELCAQLHDAGERVEIWVEHGRPVDEIRRLASDEQCSLIVTGVARNEILGRIKVGDTVEGLIRDLEIPLLVVTDRPKSPYRRITVAVDLTEVSRKALLAAVALFPGQPLAIFHAHDAPGSYGASELSRYRREHGALAESNLRNFLAATTLPEFALRPKLALEVQFGDPALQLVEWTESRDVELVVVGTRARGPVGEFFLGSVAKRVLAALSCDVLLVPARSD